MRHGILEYESMGAGRGEQGMEVTAAPLMKAPICLVFPELFISA